LDCGYCRNCKDGKTPSACENMREAGFRPDSPGGMGEYLIIEPFKNHNNLALKFGADEVIDPTACNLRDKIFKLTDDFGGSVVVEASGNDNAIASIFDIAGRSARVRLIGHSVGRKVPVEIGLTIWKTLAITGSGGIKNIIPRTI